MADHTTGNFTLESDDISSLLHTLLHNSSQPSTSSVLPPENRRQFAGSAVFPEPVELLDSNFPFAEAYYGAGVSMEGINEADGDGEEREAMRVNPAPVRSSSKRSRAAEVHNLSEKRRRQRINEKMKALQKLIPNSNKTDKASMLDEAIEYLKQLQLQVQMLTMRNSSSLHPFYLPGAAQPVQPSLLGPLVDEVNNSRVGSAADQEAAVQAMFDLSSKPASSDYKFVMPRMTENNNLGSSFVLEPSTALHHRPFNVPLPSKVLCKDPALSQLQLDMSHCGQSSSSGISS